MIDKHPHTQHPHEPHEHEHEHGQQDHGRDPGPTHGSVGHSHAHTPQNFNTAFALAVVFNLGFTFIEAFYAVLANSMSLLADAGHNLGDVLGLLLAWIANLLLTKAATEKFSYGFKRTTILASIINALILVATSTIIAYESIHKLFHPVYVHEMTVIIVALIGIVINGGTALLFMRGRHGDLNIKGAFLHLAYDALISLGVAITGIIILLTSWIRLDPMVGLLIVVVILAGTWGLLRDSVNLILDAVPYFIKQKEVYGYLKNISGVAAVHDLHIWGLSTTHVALTAHLVMPNNTLSDRDYQKIQNDLKHKHKIGHVTLQVERGKGADLDCQGCKGEGNGEG